MKQTFIIETLFVMKECFFSDERFPIPLGSRIVFWTEYFRWKLFLSACRYWDDNSSFQQMDQKFEFGGAIGYRGSYLESSRYHSKLLWLHAVLKDAVGAVGSFSSGGPGCCYTIGRWAISC